MKQIKIKNGTIDLSDSLFYFIELMKAEGKDTTDINQMVNDYMNFMSLWNNFKERKTKAAGESEFEKKLNTQILVHTIKPKTKYANQQEMKNGKPVLYPIYFFRENRRLESMAIGGNYPIEDCNIFVKSNKGNYIKIN